MPCIPHETPPRTRRPALLAVFFFVLALVAARPAWADSAESQARALQKKAMEEDYLTVDFDKALDKLNKAIAAALRTTELEKLLREQGIEPAGNSPEEFARIMHADIEKWIRVTRNAGIKPQ